MGYAAGDVNLYRYVANSPLAHLDPTGCAKFVYKPLTQEECPHHSIGGIIMWTYMNNIGLGPYGSFSGTLKLDDDAGEMSGKLKMQMFNFYGMYFKQLADVGQLTNEWRSYTIMAADTRSYTGQWILPSTSVFDTGWWLNGAERVSVYGSVEARLCNDVVVEMRNLHTLWHWHDTIDARDVFEWGRQEAWPHLREFDIKGFKRSIPNLIWESFIWDWFVDKLMDKDFPVEVSWFDDADSDIAYLPSSS